MSLLTIIILLIVTVIPTKSNFVKKSKQRIEMDNEIRKVKTSVTSCHLQCQAEPQCISYGTETNVLLGKVTTCYLMKEDIGKDLGKEIDLYVVEMDGQIGPSLETKVNGRWSTWTSWTNCSRTCEGGNMERTRICDNPSPAHGGEDCKGNSTKVKECNKVPCPIHGGWGEWNFTECSKTCGNSSRKRKRVCNAPEPSFGGLNCVLNSNTSERALNQTTLERCNMTECPGLIGTWFVSYPLNEAIYKISKNGDFDVIYYDGAAKSVTHSPLEPSDNNGALTPHDGWMKVKPIHSSISWLYMRKMDNGKLTVLWFCSQGCTKDYHGVPNYFGKNGGQGTGVLGSKCFKDYPYAYQRGNRCCKFNDACGYSMSLTSTCCKDNEWMRCSTAKCVDFN